MTTQLDLLGLLATIGDAQGDQKTPAVSSPPAMADRRRGSGETGAFFWPGRCDQLAGVLCLGELRPEHKTPPQGRQTE